MPIPEEEYVRKVLGDTLKIVVGVADSSAYLALGTDGLEQLKTSIDASAGSQPSVEPFRLDISVLPILKFAKSVEANPMVDALIQIVGDAQGSDHLRLRTAVNENTVLYRLELEEGILRILGQAGQMVIGGGFSPPRGPTGSASGHPTTRVSAGTRFHSAPPISLAAATFSRGDRDSRSSLSGHKMPWCSRSATAPAIFE